MLGLEGYMEIQVFEAPGAEPRSDQRRAAASVRRRLRSGRGECPSLEPFREYIQERIREGSVYSHFD